MVKRKCPLTKRDRHADRMSKRPYVMGLSAVLHLFLCERTYPFHILQPITVSSIPPLCPPPQSLKLLEEIKLFERMEVVGDVISHFHNFTNHMR